MKKHILAVIAVMAALYLTACGTDTSGNTSNDAGGISADFGGIGEKVGDLLGIESKEEKVLKNPLFKEGLLAVKVEDKWGYIDESGDFVIEPQFWDAENFQSNGLAVVGGRCVKNGEGYLGLGVIDKNGNYVIEPKYDKIENFDSYGIARVAENKRDEILDSGSVSTTRVYDWGLVNENGEIILETKYSMISEFDKNGIAKIGVNPKIKKTYISSYTYTEEIIYNCGLINEKGEFILEISPSNWGIGNFNYGWARVDDFPYCNYINKDGDFLIDYPNTKFGFDFLTEVDDFCSNGLAKVTVGDYYIKGFIDINGNCPIEIKYYDLGNFADGDLTYAYMHGEKYGFIDKNGNYVIEPQFDKAEDFDSNGYAKVNIGYEDSVVYGVIAEGKWGLIDKSGNYVVQPIYDEITEVKYDVAIVKSGDKYGFVNLKKNIVIEPEYSTVSFQSDRYIHLTSFTQEFDYIDIYMDFDGNIDSNAANAVCIDDTCVGFIDSYGNAQIDKKCLENIDFSNGVKTFYCNGRSGIIDVDGNVILLQDVYISSEFNTNGIAVVDGTDNDGRTICGYIKTNGEYMIEPQYKRATIFYDDHYAVVMKNDKYEIINENGENVFGQQFEMVLSPVRDYY